MVDLSVTGSSVHCATDRLKVTNDYKKTDRVGQIVSNVSESIKSANDGSIFFLGLRSVEEVGGAGIHWSPWRYCELAAENILFLTFFYPNVGGGGWVLRDFNLDFPRLQVACILILS